MSEGVLNINAGQTVGDYSAEEALRRSLKELADLKFALDESAIDDITERKRAEERIREQAALLDKARDAIVVRGLDEKILYWNEGAERIYGWTAEETVGRTARELRLLSELNEAQFEKGQRAVRER